MPARLAPVRFGINGGMGPHPSLPIFLVPDPAIRPYGRAVAGGPMPLLRPGVEHRHQLTAQAANQARQRGGQGRQAAFLGAARGQSPLLGQQGAQLRDHGVLRLEKGQQRPGRVQVANDHDHQGFDDEPIGIGPLPTSLAPRGGRGKWQMIHQADQADKKAIPAYHLSASSALSWTLKWWGGSRVQASSERGFLVKSISYGL